MKTDRSLWSEDVNLPHFPSLTGEHQTDVLIIGGGLTGLLCAYYLDQSGIDYLLAEKKTICSGVTGNTTGKITSQHGLIYDKLIRTVGRERAGMYLDANQQALLEFCRLSKEAECDYEEKDAYVYSKQDTGILEQEADALRSLGIEAEVTNSIPLPFQTAGAVKFPKQGQFHPLKFAAGITKGLHIYEHTFIQELNEGVAIAESGSIKAETVIVATHFPFLNKHGFYSLKMYQRRSYLLALEQGQDVEGMYIDAAQDGISLRNYKDLLLVGGGGHRTGKKGGSYEELDDFTQRHYPQALAKFRWAAQDCMSLDGIPYIGQYSSKTSGLYVASGFNKWGMTQAMAAARIITDKIKGIRNEHAEVFSPSRSILKPQLFVNGAKAAVNLASFRGKRCTHLGCALKWNPQERSWDCPCHGSRFSEEGQVIDNPAQRDKELFPK